MIDNIELSPELLKKIEEQRLIQESQYPDFDGPRDLIEYKPQKETQVVEAPKKKKRRNKKRLSQEEVNLARATGKKIRGANRKHDDDVILAAIYDLGGNAQKIAKELGYGYRRLRKIISTTPELKKAIEEARADHREETLDRVEDRLEMMARSGNIKAMTLYLKAHGESRGYVERRQLSTADDKPLQIVVRRS